jgi:hypothetical protein
LDVVLSDISIFSRHNAEGLTQTKTLFGGFILDVFNRKPASLVLHPTSLVSIMFY